MTNIPRYLITTADERTWKFDRSVIFLGEWCRVYERKHIWQDMDAIVAAPYGLGQDLKDADHVEARRQEEKLFPILYDALNQHHGTRHGARFWRIIIGPWLRHYVDVVFNRVKTLEQCLQTYQLSGTAVFANENYSLAPRGSLEAIWSFNDNRWDNVLCVNILNLLGGEKCPVEVIPCDDSEGYRKPLATIQMSWKRRIINRCHQAGKLAGLLVRKNDAFIINSYLPKKEVVKLQLSLAQVPQLWISPKLEFAIQPDRELRKNLSNLITEKTSDILLNILLTMVFELLPVCYLEGFNVLTETVQQLPWPKKPKFIFTSNNFANDELFKLWTALKVEDGILYVTGQHGNNYGTHRYMYPSVEEETADKFLTWGWTDGLPQHSPAFIFKTVGCKAESYNPAGGLLLTEVHEPHRITPWDSTAEFVEYFEDQFTFVEELHHAPRRNLTVRLHGAYVHRNWSEDARWREFDPTLKLDTANKNSIKELIAQSRLVIHSYDSTGILETLSQNIPTLAFWQNGFEHLRDSAKSYYQLLVDVGIVHLTPESAANKVNEIWDDVGSWWSQSVVQEARIQFCNRYAKVSQSPVRDLKKVLQR